MAKTSTSRNQRVTSSDIARFVGVSQATVSRAFSHDSSITDLTRAKILDAARQLNYVPNSFARSLITRQSNIVAMLLGDLNNPFYTVALDEFSLRLQAVGKQVLVFNGASPNEVDDAVRRMLEYQVDGLILTAATTSMQVTSLCLEREIPVVMFNRYVPGFSGNSVCCDNFDGGRLAADTLFDAGATRFAVISGDSVATTNLDRVRGFAGRLAERGVHEVPECWGHYTYEGGYRAAVDLLSRKDAPDALFCVNDIMALGVIDAARELGRAIPGDLKIIGFDDIVEASRPPYRLTTIRQPMRQMVNAAMTMLKDGPANEPVSRILKGRLIERATVKAG
jgi:DNA-binding LacI/PurR family transcriptional regulator